MKRLFKFLILPLLILSPMLEVNSAQYNGGTYIISPPGGGGGGGGTGGGVPVAPNTLAPIDVRDDATIQEASPTTVNIVSSTAVAVPITQAWQLAMPKKPWIAIKTKPTVTSAACTACTAPSATASSAEIATFNTCSITYRKCMARRAVGTTLTQAQLDVYKSGTNVCESGYFKAHSAATSTSISSYEACAATYVEAKTE